VINGELATRPPFKEINFNGTSGELVLTKWNGSIEVYHPANCIECDRASCSDGRIEHTVQFVSFDMEDQE
jgi:hypothetical protein